MNVHDNIHVPSRLCVCTLPAIIMKSNLCVSLKLSSVGSPYVFWPRKVKRNVCYLVSHCRSLSLPLLIHIGSASYLAQLSRWRGIGACWLVGALALFIILAVQVRPPFFHKTFFWLVRWRKNTRRNFLSRRWSGRKDPVRLAVYGQSETMKMKEFFSLMPLSYQVNDGPLSFHVNGGPFLSALAREMDRPLVAFYRNLLNSDSAACGQLATPNVAWKMLLSVIGWNFFRNNKIGWKSRFGFVLESFSVAFIAFNEIGWIYFTRDQSINQSIDTSINQSKNCPVNQPNNQSINQSEKYPVNQPTNQSIDQSIVSFFVIRF